MLHCLFFHLLTTGYYCAIFSILWRRKKRRQKNKGLGYHRYPGRKKKREGVLCWPITERSNVNTVILPTPFFTTFPLLFTEVCRVTNVYVERGRRSGIFFLGIINASDLYQLKEPFLRAFWKPWNFWQNDSEKADVDGKFFAKFSSK